MRNGSGIKAVKRTMKTFAASGLFLALLAAGGCKTLPPTTPISTSGMVGQRIEAGLDRWPTATTDRPAIKRPFFATIHAMGWRMTASGVMQFNGPRDVRVTAANELGALLFDGRVNWAGVTVLRQAPGMNKGMIEALLLDLSASFELPESLDGLAATEGGRGDEVILQRKPGDLYHYVWMFDGRNGQLRATDIELGKFDGTDTLHVEFRSYNARGWPEDMVVQRKAHGVEVSLTFTDNNVVQAPARHNAQ